MTPAHTPLAARPPSDDPAVVRRTQVLDLVRAVPAGVLLPIETTVVLTIAIREFDAPGWAKGLIAASSGVGMLCAPAITAAVRRNGRSTMSAAGAVALIGAVGFVVSSSGPLALLVVGAIVGIAAISAPIPLVTTMYERNFAAHDRGRRVGRGMSLRVAVSAVSGLAMGALLTAVPAAWRFVMLGAAVAMTALAWSFRHTPSEPLANSAGTTATAAAGGATAAGGAVPAVLPHFHLLRHDQRLRLTLTAWMFMGFGNLMLLPLRVEFLASPDYGIDADPTTITLLTVAIPSLVRLSCLPAFGRLFDRMSFFSARIMVNLFFALYIAAFFSGSTMAGLVIGAIVLGVASAGGDLMWTLWVTKFAPPGQVADYMGLHTFFTGARAVVAPLLAFYVVGRMELAAVAWMAAGLIMVASLLLVPQARLEHRRAVR